MSSSSPASEKWYERNMKTTSWNQASGMHDKQTLRTSFTTLCFTSFYANLISGYSRRSHFESRQTSTTWTWCNRCIRMGILVTKNVIFQWPFYCGRSYQISMWKQTCTLDLLLLSLCASPFCVWVYKGYCDSFLLRTKVISWVNVWAH